MNGFPVVHTLSTAVFSGLVALSLALPAAASPSPARGAEPQDQELQQLRAERRRNNASEERPRVAAERPSIREREPRSSDDQRRENWGEMARRQLDRQQSEEPRRNPGQFSSQRPWQQPASPQPPSEQRHNDNRRPGATAPNPPPSSAVGSVISQVREREAQQHWPNSRPDRPNYQRPDNQRPGNQRPDRPDNQRPDRPRPGQHEDWRPQQPGDRISQRDQQRRIDQQRHQHNQWQRDESRRHNDWNRYQHHVEQARRHAQHRYQQDYWRRWLASQQRWNAYRYDYYNDPFFYTPYNYRYSYGGRWYSTNSYGAQMLQQAIQDGYREGWYAGRADRDDRWRFDYRGNYGYIDGTYGYPGYYVSMSDYQYYFRQGFERGYRDGYFGRTQYGRYDRDGAVILPAIVSMILAFTIL
ncbi:MAG: hypothetical protein KUL77_01175 [Thermomonas sp.]|uniref:hypothetical protein n=1 Tax=Thermomonas sp. TaxID=1971895 RepID=UPI001EBEBE71|nr:hypothetical protein [Thermomonas sp.]MBV2208162.1 hypothetical protein [Thermomonas sp.]